MFDTDGNVFLKEFFEKVYFAKKFILPKNQQTTKKHAKLPSMQRVNLVLARDKLIFKMFAAYFSWCFRLLSIIN